MARVLSANPGMTDKAAAVAVGFSPNYSTAEIKKGKAFQLAQRGIEEERENLRLRRGYRLQDVAGRMKHIATATRVVKVKDEATQEEREEREFVEQARDRIAADDRIIKMLDYEPAKKVDIQSKALLMEFTGLTGADLQDLIEYQKRYGELPEA